MRFLRELEKHLLVLSPAVVLELRVHSEFAPGQTEQQVFGGTFQFEHGFFVFSLKWQSSWLN